MSSPTRHEPFHLHLAHYIFAGVLLVRAIALARLASSPLLLPTRGDMQFYSDWAQRILSGHATTHLAFYGLPGYAWLLAFIFNLFGYAPFVAGLLQCLLDAGTAVLIYRISLRLWNDAGRRVAQASGILAAVGWAFFVPAQSYSIILMPTAWVVFVFWLSVWLVVRRPESPSMRGALCLGLLIGICATAVATILCLLPLVVAALVGRARLRRADEQPSSRFAPTVACAMLLFGVLAGTAPCWIYNYFHARDPVFLSAHSGINFWIGNNPDANGYPHFPPGLRAGQTAMLQDSISVAETAVGHPLKRSEVSRYWSAKAWRFITEQPSSWLRLLALKFRNFWNAFQYDDLSVITILREQGITLPGIYFGITAALALPAILLAWNQPLSRWVIAAIFLHLVAILAVFTTERYRLPIVPGLLIFASYGAVMFCRNLAGCNFKPVLIYGSLLLVSALFVSWPQPDRSLWALDPYNAGWQALEAGDLGLAERKLQLARAYVPTNAEVNFALGNLRLAQSNLPEAETFYRLTLRYDAVHPGALNNLAVLALQRGDAAAAEALLAKGLRIEPTNAKTHFLLAKSLAARGDIATARYEAARAVALKPDQGEFRAFREALK